MSEAPILATELAAPRGRSLPRIAPAMSFAALLSVLLFAALFPRVSPPPRVHGLLPGADAAEAARILQGRMVIPTSDVRFTSTLTGEAQAGVRAASDLDLRLARAEDFIARAAAERPRDARGSAALAAIDLARHRYADAERRYRAALDRSPRFAEARLGLGVTLALRAEIERHPLPGRRLRLQAIAQLAAVTPEDPEYAAALFGRAMLLERVGRHAEARELARLYRTVDPASGWSERVRTHVPTS